MTDQHIEARAAGVPAIAWTARLTLVLVLAQFALAGLAFYASPALWAAHGIVGSCVLLPVMLLLVQSRQGRGFAHLRPGIWGLLALYLAQVLLAVLSEKPEMLVLRAAHVGNAALRVRLRGELEACRKFAPVERFFSL